MPTRQAASVSYIDLKFWAFLFYVFFSQNLVQSCTPSSRGGKGGKQRFMWKKLLVPSSQHVILRELTPSVHKRGQGGGWVDVLRSVCRIRGQGQGTWGWPVYLPICLHCQTQCHWEPLTHICSSNLHFSSEPPLLAGTGHWTSKWPTYPTPTLRHRRPITGLWASLPCLSHLLTYLHPATQITRSQIQEMS